ncbi:MAG: hypothetical protein KC492_01205 [Myxococcales bacterium]|nr:hypothetical protein [Myxococcales bacterium]
MSRLSDLTRAGAVRLARDVISGKLLLCDVFLYAPIDDILEQLDELHAELRASEVAEFRDTLEGDWSAQAHASVTHLEARPQEGGE